MSTMAWLFILVIAVVAAFAIGWFFATRTGRLGSLQTERDTAQAELQRYQEEVNTHFEKTAHLFNEVTGSYRSLYEHLASGSEKLGNAQVSSALTSRPEQRKLPEKQVESGTGQHEPGTEPAAEPGTESGTESGTEPAAETAAETGKADVTGHQAADSAAAASAPTADPATPAEADSASKADGAPGADASAGDDAQARDGVAAEDKSDSRPTEKKRVEKKRAQKEAAAASGSEDYLSSRKTSA